VVHFIPVRLLSHSSPEFAKQLAAFCASASVPREIQKSVAGILADIRSEGDRAVVRYAKKFDRATLRPRDFRIPSSLLAEAAKALPSQERKAILAARACILDYNRRGLPKDWSAKNPQGATVGERHYPIRRVGLYVPGGQVPLVSTVLMTVTLAKIAGCPEIAVCTPSGPTGSVAPSLLAALHLCGIDEVYRVGGVQAVGAMAYGTASIPPWIKFLAPATRMCAKRNGRSLVRWASTCCPAPAKSW